MLRSVEYALIVSIAGTVFAMLFAYYMDRRRIIGRSPFRLPGDAALYAAGHVLRHRLHSRVQPRAAQADGHGPYRAGQHALQAAADLHEDLHASLALLPEVQERSARDLGAGRLAVLRDVVFPALRPAFLSCFVYNFTSSMTTAGSIIFLIDAKRQLAVFKLFDAVYQGDYALASLIASVITVIVLLVEGLAFLITRKGENRRVSRT
ncbi:MAG: ABC transporter permease subunit [Oscillibacter sp.]